MDFMDTPTPIGSESTLLESNKVKQEANFFMKSNKNNIFNINIKSIQSYLLFTANIKEDFYNIKFEKIFLRGFKKK